MSQSDERQKDFVSFEMIEIIVLCILRRRKNYTLNLLREMLANYAPHLNITTLYRRIQKLDEIGLIEKVPRQKDEYHRIVYYKLTKLGESILQQELVTWSRYSSNINILFAESLES